MTMDREHRPEIEDRRELAVLRYVQAVDLGDLDAVAELLAGAEMDPELDRRIAEVNAALHAETELPAIDETQVARLLLRHWGLKDAFEREEPMDTLTMLRQQILDAREYLEATMADVTPEQARWNAEGKALPIAAQYAHIIVSMDGALHHLLQGTAPLAAATWAGRTGFAEVPPVGPGLSWEQWANGPFDLDALRAYARAVYAATDEYLASLTVVGLGRPLDLSWMGLGERTVGWMLSTGWVTNANMHCGEISCLKGLQGARGYPF